MSLSEWRKQKLSSHPLQSLYYFSKINNLSSILKNGILSKNTVTNSVYSSESFAEESVQEKRHRKIIELSNNSEIPLHDLVPLYMTPKTPTLSARRNIQSEIFFVEVSLSVIWDGSKEFAFTDGNAGAHETKFFHSLYKLAEIPWNVIAAPYWNEHEDGRRKRCSEFLIYPSIEPSYFKRLVVVNDIARNNCESIAKRAGLKIAIDTVPQFFFT